jgi:hypothetical protein
MRWSNGIAEWITQDTAFVSAVFSWNAQKAFSLCCYYRDLGYHVRCGGQSVWQNPAMFSEFDTGGEVDALSHHNPLATYTSRGCIRKCSFCLVPKIEGALVELKSWKVRPIICDNNLLATSLRHFNKVIDLLLDGKITGIDFNGGLDARILSDQHAKRFAELPGSTIIRLAWDDLRSEKQYLKAFDKLIKVGIRPRQIRTYVLFGYQDTPEDARYRLEKVVELGGIPNPMRYQPLDAQKRNSYVAPAWTASLLARYYRYWSYFRNLTSFSFDEYIHGQNIPAKRGSQPELF